MSHYCVYVFHDNSTSIGELLAPYDENLEMDEPVILYTKQQAIDQCREDIEYYKNSTYKEYLNDPLVYEEKYGYNKSHINYLKTEFPKRLNWTDEECYNYMKRGYETDDNGNILTEYNPNSQWDWYEVGGRFNGIIPDNEVILSNIDISKLEVPYAFISTNGEWFEKGVTTNEISEDNWDVKFRNYVNTLDKNTIVTCIDCHI